MNGDTGGEGRRTAGGWLGIAGGASGVDRGSGGAIVDGFWLGAAAWRHARGQTTGVKRGCDGQRWKGPLAVAAAPVLEFSAFTERLSQTL